MRFGLLLLFLTISPALAFGQTADTMNVNTCVRVTSGWVGTCPDNINEDPPGDDGSAFIYSTTLDDTLIVDFTTPQLSDYDSVQLQWRLGRSGNPATTERIGWDTSSTWTTSDVSVTSAWATYTMSITGSPDSAHVANLEAIFVMINDNNKDQFVTMICAIGYYTEPSAARSQVMRIQIDD